MVGPAVRLRVVLVVLGLFAAVCACAGPAPCAGVGVVSGVGLMFPHEGYDNSPAPPTSCAREASA
jgi:hypothetical protein